MEAIGMGLQAIGKAIGAWATAYAFIYIAGIGTKTFLIYTGKAKMDEMKDWFNFFKKIDFKWGWDPKIYFPKNNGGLLEYHIMNMII